MQSENKLLDPNSVFQFSKNSNKKFDDITIQTPGIQKTQDQLLLSTKRNVYMLELDDFDDKQKTNRESYTEQLKNNQQENLQKQISLYGSQKILKQRKTSKNLDRLLKFQTTHLQKDSNKVIKNKQDFKQRFQIAKLGNMFRRHIQDIEPRRYQKIQNSNYVYEGLMDRTLFLEKRKHESKIVLFFHNIYRRCKKLLLINKIYEPDSNIVFVYDLIASIFNIFWFFIYSMHLFYQDVVMIKSSVIISILVISNIFFFSEFLLRFHIGYYEHGKLITDKTQISQKYKKTSMYFDVLGFLAQIYNFMDDSLSIWNIFFESIFFLKYLSFIETVARIEWTLYLKGFSTHLIELSKMLFQILFMSHIIASMWHLLSYIEKNYDLAEDRYIDQFNYTEDETFKRYIVTYYWAVATLMLVGSSGNNSIETAFTIITLLWTVGIFAYIISKISMIIQELNQDSSMFKKELSIMNKFMLSKDIPQDLQTKVRSCLEYMFKSSDQLNINRSAQEVLQKFPKNLQEQVKQKSNQIVLQNFPYIWRTFDKIVLEELIDVMEEIPYVTNEQIFTQGQNEDIYLYFILKGRVEILQKSSDQDGKIKQFSIGSFKQGQVLGDYNFLTGLSYQYTAVCQTFVNTCRIQRDKFVEILNKQGYQNRQIQYFCYFKDYLIQNQVYKDQYFRKCVICQSDYHLEQNCNLLNYRPNKYMLSLKNNRQNDKKERQKLKECRKIDRKHISPLLDIQQLQKLSDNLKNKYYKDKEIKLYFKFIAQLNQSDSNSSLTSIVSYSDDDSDSYLSRSQFQTESSYQSQLSNQNRYQKAENQIQRKNYSQKTQISQLKQIQSIKQNNKLSSKKSQKGQSLECNLQNKDQNISDKIEGKSRKNSLTGSKSKNVSIFCTNYDKDQISQTGNNEYKQNQALNQLPNKFLSNQKFRSNQNTNNNSFDEQYAIHDTSLNQVHQDIYNTDWANKKRGKPQFYQQYSNQISQQSIGNKSYQQQILSQNQTINIDEYSSGYECSNQQPSEGEYNKIYTNENKIKQDQKQYLYDDQIMGQQGNILDQKGILKNKNYNQKQNFRHLKDQLSKIIEPNVGYYQNQNAKNKQKNKITNFKSSCELDEEDLEDIQVVSSRHPNTRVQSQDYQQNQVHDQVISHLNSNMAHIDQSYQQQEFNQPENNLFAEFFKVKKKQDLNGKLMRERFGSLQKKKTHTRKQGTIEDSQFSISSEHKAFDNSIVNRNYFLEGNNQVYKSKNDIEYQSAKEQEEYRKKQQKKEKNIIREFVKSKSQLAKELQHDNQKLKVLCQGLLEQIVEHNKINPSTKLQQFSDQNIQSQIYKILFKKQDSQYSQNYSLNNQKQVQRNIVRGNHYPSSENKQKMFQNIGNKTSTIENDMNSNYNYNKNYNTLKTLESKNSLLKEKDGNNQLSRFLSKQRRKSIEEEFSMNNFFKMIGLGDNNQNNEDINQLYESKRSFQRNGSYISENKNVYMPNLNVNSFSEQQQTQQIPARSQKNRHVSLLDLQQKNNFNLEDQIKELVVQMDQKQLNEQMFFEFDVQKNWEVYYPQFNLNFQIKTYNQKFLKKEEERNNVKDKMKRRQSKYVNKINTNVNSANTSKSNLDNLGFSQRVKIQQQQDNENSGNFNSNKLSIYKQK